MNTILQLNKEELRELIQEFKHSTYDPVFGMDKDNAKQHLGIKSDTTFYDRVRNGKILSKEVGGSIRYFLPK